MAIVRLPVLSSSGPSCVPCDIVVAGMVSFHSDSLTSNPSSSELDESEEEELLLPPAEEVDDDDEEEEEESPSLSV